MKKNSPMWVSFLWYSSGNNIRTLIEHFYNITNRFFEPAILQNLITLRRFILCSNHSLHKTFFYHLYKIYKDVALLQALLNHSSPSITLRYIGISQDNIDESFLVSDDEGTTFSADRNISILVGDIAPQSKARINILIKCLQIVKYYKHN